VQGPRLVLRGLRQLVTRNHRVQQTELGDIPF
jgi:hypothetical protein